MDLRAIRVKKAFRQSDLVPHSVVKTTGKLYLSSTVALASQGLIGTNVFTKDWDVLIILDTCRVDALKQVAPEYEFINDIKTVWSVGGSSPEWIGATFSRDWESEIQDTAYLSSNGFAKQILEEREWPKSMAELYNWSDWDIILSTKIGRLEHLWKYELREERGALGHFEGHTPPDYVTDRGIAVGREYNFNRIILHYNQPHAPYTSLALDENRKLLDHEREPFRYLWDGGDRDCVWNAYIENLRYVLDSVEIVLNNIDAERVVISADHGEAFGEFGGINHRAGSLNPYVRQVPWTVTSATDSDKYTPVFNPINSSENSIKETLETLGYDM